MRPRAEFPLEHVGFEDVYDYVPGKSDWTAAQLPREGKSAVIPNAGDVVSGSPIGFVIGMQPFLGSDLEVGCVNATGGTAPGDSWFALRRLLPKFRPV